MQLVYRNTLRRFPADAENIVYDKNRETFDLAEA